MGKLEETQEAYFGHEEKVIVEKDKMSLPHALMILHGLLDRMYFGENVEEAFKVVFEWINNMALLLAWERVKELTKTGGNDEAAANEAGLADAPGTDQDDRSGA